MLKVPVIGGPVIGGGGGKHVAGVGCRPNGAVKKLLATSLLLCFHFEAEGFVSELDDYVAELLEFDLVGGHALFEMIGGDFKSGDAGACLSDGVAWAGHLVSLDWWKWERLAALSFDCGHRVAGGVV